jgi:DNA-binding PadR family transcriptional regulator
MGKQAPLGEFEVVVLMSVLHVGEDAFGSAIRDDIEARSGRPTSRGAVYITLDRLEDKGLLSSTLGEGTSARGMRPRRYFTLTPDGVKALQSSLKLVATMHRGLEAVLGKLS